MTGSDEAEQSAAPMKLLRRLQYRLRSVARPRRGAPVSFVYDLHSYSKNFDDGLSSSDHHL